MQLSEIKGIGQKRLKKLNDVGIFSPLDLLQHFPYKYLDTTKQADFSLVAEGDDVVFCGLLISEPQFKYIRKGLSYVKANFVAGGKTVGCTWFNQRHIVSRLSINTTYIISGKIKRFKGNIDISAPLLSDFCQGQDVIPLYRPLKGLPLSVLTSAIREVLFSVKVNSFLTKEQSQKYGIIPLNAAFYAVHLPQTVAQATVAMRTIALENLSYTICAYLNIKHQNCQNATFVYKDNAKQLNNVIKTLPYILTQEQQVALDEIINSLHANQPMNRLLQGDVGCGKTIIALLCMFYAHLSGFQSVLMCPTELLCRQHYLNAIKYFEHTGVKIAYLSGSLSVAERANTLFLIKNGMVDMVIGTHALIQQGVQFNCLSLIVTDEQQRFGVNQRSELENKSTGCDSLTMTATPIPRTLALTLYGELEQSRILSLPNGRAKIVTRIVRQQKEEDMLRYLQTRAAAGEQAYIVCPRITPEDNLVSVEQMQQRVQKLCPTLRVSALHGQMRDADKSAVMKQFNLGNIDVVVATTVVEVGLDVPNATTMIIYNAERYGLSQLHQLRGRVGRGVKDSFCFILAADSASERLEFFCGCSSGFDLAEYDFKKRGAGDFIGTKQHGETDSLCTIDAEFITQAKDIATQLLADQNITNALKNNIGNSGLMYIKSITLN